MHWIFSLLPRVFQYVPDKYNVHCTCETRTGPVPSIAAFYPTKPGGTGKRNSFQSFLSPLSLSIPPFPPHVTRFALTGTVSDPIADPPNLSLSRLYFSQSPTLIPSRSPQNAISAVRSPRFALRCDLDRLVLGNLA